MVPTIGHLRAEVDCILSYALMQDYSFPLKDALDTVIADTHKPVPLEVFLFFLNINLFFLSIC